MKFNMDESKKELVIALRKDGKISEISSSQPVKFDALSDYELVICTRADGELVAYDDRSTKFDFVEAPAKDEIGTAFTLDGKVFDLALIKLMDTSKLNKCDCGICATVNGEPVEGTNHSFKGFYESVYGAEHAQTTDSSSTSDSSDVSDSKEERKHDAPEELIDANGETHKVLLFEVADKTHISVAEAERIIELGYAQPTEFGWFAFTQFRGKLKPSGAMLEPFSK